MNKDNKKIDYDLGLHGNGDNSVQNFKVCITCRQIARTRDMVQSWCHRCDKKLRETTTHLKSFLQNEIKLTKLTDQVEKTKNEIVKATTELSELKEEMEELSNINEFAKTVMDRFYNGDKDPELIFPLDKGKCVTDLEMSFHLEDEEKLIANITGDASLTTYFFSAITKDMISRGSYDLNSFLYVSVWLKRMIFNNEQRTRLSKMIKDTWIIKKGDSASTFQNKESMWYKEGRLGCNVVVCKSLDNEDATDIYPDETKENSFNIDDDDEDDKDDDDDDYDDDDDDDDYDDDDASATSSSSSSSSGSSSSSTAKAKTSSPDDTKNDRTKVDNEEEKDYSSSSSHSSSSAPNKRNELQNREDDDLTTSSPLKRSRQERIMGQCSALLRRIEDMDYREANQHFRYADDLLHRNLPGYSDVIEEPMGLLTLRRMMNMNKIKDHKEYARLLRLVFQNEMKYNTDQNSFEHGLAKEFLKFFEKTYEEKVMKAFFANMKLDGQMQESLDRAHESPPKKKLKGDSHQKGVEVTTVRMGLGEGKNFQLVEVEMKDGKSFEAILLSPCVNEPKKWKCARVEANEDNELICPFCVRAWNRKGFCNHSKHCAQAKDFIDSI